MTTYSYYAEPGYWDTGYTEDITVNFVYGSAATSSTGVVIAVSNYLKDIAGAGAGASATKAAGSFVYLDGALVGATATTKAVGQTIFITSGVVPVESWARGSLEVKRTYPGVNLNAKSSLIAGIGVTRKTSATAGATSSTKAGSRIFWENTQPASGTWTIVVPQAEGTGE